MRYKVILTKDAANNFRRLVDSIKRLVAKQLKKLESSPFLGDPLGNVRGFNLTGFYKIYAAKKSIRIVYRIIEEDIVVEIVGIGKRAEFEVYADIARRLMKKK
ncbi:MAG: type II toxin-antitoxin system RelE/ParE family toxin [Candidatus Scalindua sp.]|nr:type II toxin-antitoxin system RelE/ParE family toxin [Candidatus Scalindua sp.]MBT5306380.1 type II toxin-antitoxin system RelE/ParE family toxin [Candidatus Scalindua sp.]MBT6050008.1 type II toxin-antitoxin system RelE/ParE family toxin [Candidatus Scalindua sp.]MBT6230635.1 type II toxin-antitoxin system RelE/ParE family toxin [Candidatus Scalindua sp.]MBT6564637.1 type II toxin-antitoxin system RelE/ParE family toxin [Candidatus Scalindua sp.]